MAEDTIIVILATEDREAVMSICDELKEKLNQNSILVTSDKLSAEYK